MRPEPLALDSAMSTPESLHPTVTFTVFTPTWKRDHLIHRVFEALCAQTFRDFEWIVVEDGSTGQTRALVEEWSQVAEFPVRYFWQPNQGKHVAHNLALEHAQGRFFIVLDDDDACVPQALEYFYYYWNLIPFAQQRDFAGIGVHCVSEYGELSGDPYPEPIFDATYLEMKYGRKVTGEKWFAFCTDVLRAYPYPVFPGSSYYLVEDVVWTKIARKYKMRFVNSALRIYYQHQGHDQITRRLKREQINYRAIAPVKIVEKRQYLSDLTDYLPGNWKLFYLTGVHYTRFSFHQGIPLAGQWRDIGNSTGRALWLAGLPIGLALFGRDLLIMQKNRRSGWTG